MGRRPSGAGLVDGLAGTAEEKQRLTVILRTLTGDLTIAAACDALGVSPSRFHELRQAALTGALGALAPRAPGRPATGPPPPDPVHVAALEAEVQELRLEVEAAKVREMLAIAAPGTVVWGPPPAASKKKTTGGPDAR
jgi:hypothetical protein